jgi:hypothetical protein
MAPHYAFVCVTQYAVELQRPAISVGNVYGDSAQTHGCKDVLHQENGGFQTNTLLPFAVLLNMCAYGACSMYPVDVHHVAVAHQRVGFL